MKKRNIKQEQGFGKKHKVLAIDFDGVLCEDCYPKIGKPNEDMIKYFKKRKADGDKLILWTCRKGIHLNNAVKWCKKYGLKFDAINENLPDRIKKYGGDTRKVFADLYFDDHSFANLGGLSDVIVPYNLGDIVYYRKSGTPSEFYGVIKAKVTAIHLTEANKRSHITIKPIMVPWSTIQVRFDKVKDELFSNKEDAERCRNSYNSSSLQYENQK